MIGENAHNWGKSREKIIIPQQFPHNNFLLLLIFFNFANDLLYLINRHLIKSHLWLTK